MLGNSSSRSKSGVLSDLPDEAVNFPSPIQNGPYRPNFSGHLPPGGLLDMYHGHEATDPRDKVFAMLGMSSDDILPLKSLAYCLTTTFYGKRRTREASARSNWLHWAGALSCCAFLWNKKKMGRLGVRGRNHRVEKG